MAGILRRPMGTREAWVKHGHLWNDSTTIVGDAGMGETVPYRPGGQLFVVVLEDRVNISTSKAIIVTGKMELVGGGGASAYTWLRYALTYQDSSN